MLLFCFLPIPVCGQELYVVGTFSAFKSPSEGASMQVVVCWKENMVKILYTYTIDSFQFCIHSVVN